LTQYRHESFKFFANAQKKIILPTHIGTFGFLPPLKANSKKPKEPIFPPTNKPIQLYLK